MSGGVSRAPTIPQGNWGSRRSDERLELLITDSKKRIIFPSTDIPLDYKSWEEYSHLLAGHTEMSPDLMLPDFSPPLGVVAGQEFQIWLGQDYSNIGDEDNHGTSCCDVYAYYA